MSGQTLIERLRHIRGRAVRAEAMVPLLDEVLAALSHPAVPLRLEACDVAASVPKGWRLVPEEATPEMLSRAMRDCGGIGGGSCGEYAGIDCDDLRSVYDAMLAAAPSPAPTPESVATDDTKRLDWIERQDLGDLSLSFDEDGKYMVHVNHKTAYSRNLRGAIDARMTFDAKENTDE